MNGRRAIAGVAVLWVWYLTLHLLDAATTVGVLGRGGFEANGLMAAIMAHGGYASLFAIKAAAAVLVGLATIAVLAMAQSPIRRGPAKRLRSWFHARATSIEAVSYLIGVAMLAYVVGHNAANWVMLEAGVAFDPAWHVALSTCIAFVIEACIMLSLSAAQHARVEARA